MRLYRTSQYLLVAALALVAACPQPPAPPPPDEFERGFGAEAPTREFVEARPQAINPFAASTTAQLPSSADLTRDIPNIGDQGMLGSCTAWAAGYAGASYTANRQFTWGMDGLAQSEIASPGYLYERLLETDGFECGSGTFINTALDLLIAEGCASFAVVDYSDQVCTPNPANDDAGNFRIGSYNRVVETDLDALRGELARGAIIVIGARLDDDFQAYTGTPEVYVGSGNPLFSGAQHAAHAMAVVGYDDNREAFRIMNSWSTLWGDNGFMWMHYDTFKRTVFEAYSIEPTAQREPVDPVDPMPDPTDVTFVLDDAFQFADVEQDENGMPRPVVYLVFYVHATAPVFLESYSIEGPDGIVAEMDYANQYVDGYLYAVSNVRFTPGSYDLNFNVQLSDGTSNTIMLTEINVGDLNDGGGETGLCTDTCIFAYDGECDDGGEGSLFDLCDLGSDCSDCGARDADGGDGEGLCSNTCRFAGDGECDDGGPDADFAVCAFGTDCDDCGSRDRSGGELCENYCDFAFDGECDDGGPDADFSICDFGSDCGDCGARTLDDIGDLLGCENTCPFAGDGECDDGGAGALFDVCGFGTDCSDCGPRDGDGGLCEDTCPFAGDFECDDGGPGSDFSVCEFGTDCFDCGVRDGSDDGGFDILCEDFCFDANDGFCDDGGFDADTDLCDFGSDCSDCGPRDVSDDGGFDILCEDFCFDANDGFCDDGGFDADTDLCDFGSDCSDCGPRDLSDFKTVARGAKSATKAELMRTAKIAKSLTPAVKPSVATRTAPEKYFRGVKVMTPAAAKQLPARGMHEGVLGPNRKPVRILGSDRK